MDFIQITKDAFRNHLELFHSQPHSGNNDYHYHHACAYEALLRDFKVPKDEIQAIINSFNTVTA